MFHMWMTDGYEYFLNPMGGESPDDYTNKTNDLSHPVKKVSGTLPVKMFGPFWSVCYKIALAEWGVSLP